MWQLSKITAHAKATISLFLNNKSSSLTSTLQGFHFILFIYLFIYLFIFFFFFVQQQLLKLHYNYSAKADACVFPPIIFLSSTDGIQDSHFPIVCGSY